MGGQILANFLDRVCGCTGTWRLATSPSKPSTRCAERVGSERVICGLSGGVDSSVVAALLYRGDRFAVLVHPGRQRPAAQGRSGSGDSRISATTSRPTCTWSRAEERFLDALAGVTDPQEKRTHHRPRVHRRASPTKRPRSKGAEFLAQGTLYPDVIESGAAADGPAATIKTASQRRRVARGYWALN